MIPFLIRLRSLRRLKRESRYIAPKTEPIPAPTALMRVSVESVTQERGRVRYTPTTVALLPVGIIWVTERGETRKRKERCLRNSLLYPPNAPSKYVWEKDDKKQIEPWRRLKVVHKFHCGYHCIICHCSKRVPFLPRITGSTIMDV